MIDAAGHGEHFGHGLGHGVGLEIHEAPWLSQTLRRTLEDGNVVTVEPGVYLPGELGMRIEDLLVARERRGRDPHLGSASSYGSPASLVVSRRARPPHGATQQARGRYPQRP